MSYTKKYQPKKNNYITDSEYDKALEFYYNGKDYTKAIEWVVEKDLFKEEIKDKLLFEGEYYRKVRHHRFNLGHFIYTNLGRIVNTHTGKQIAPLITPGSVLPYFGYTSISLKTLFNYAKWDYDHETIVANYFKYNWKYIKYKYAKKR